MNTLVTGANRGVGRGVAIGHCGGAALSWTCPNRSSIDSCPGGGLDLSNSESPEFGGWVVAALVRDPSIMERSRQNPGWCGGC